jgi:hypothetical protein
MSQSDQKGLGGNVYITSNNQSGGVTAQNVNINARAQRVMGDNLKIGLLGQIPKDKPIVVWSLMGNEEALRYATEIFNFMKISGYNLIGNAPFSQIWTAPLYGVEVKFDPDKTHISVGFFDGTEQPRHNLP